MGKIKKPKYYPPKEEKLNILSHGIGFILSIVALVMLILKALEIGEHIHLISFIIFGASMVLVYAASTFYHSAKTHRLRMKLNILDHAAIYILIAGTYTPFALITLNGTTGWIILWVVWLMALVGVILKLFYAGRYQLLSTIMYVAMGWLIIFALNPLIENLSTPGLQWLFAGGISYTIGAVFFMLNKISFNHAIFHIFVLLGTFAHFVSIYFYILPAVESV
ncbi:PAQR family membrane homeostasis protein TrhA [Christiangramia forsetii]|uniref:Hemolysin-3 family protein n=2 Tax=Christiangramia forsetii TaxID=411153 RepID=A0LZC4_CHRFK|nr:hemolysin III family protein [Christiangramia forsetii]GGG37982.1 hemolysin III [Christiangramia forsetii]CAL65719.1 hemolysin-3 family protein [Christiangramia forsetii KT0803]